MSEYAISFTVPLTPPSVNALYNVFRFGKRVEVKLKPEILIFKTKVKMYVPVWTLKHAGELLFFSMTLFDHAYFFKNGSLRKVDITNTEKALLDSICERIGIDDKYVKERHLYHKPSTDGKTKMDIKIGVLNENAA